jgi:hypothetical protein
LAFKKPLHFLVAQRMRLTLSRGRVSVASSIDREGHSNSDPQDDPRQFALGQRREFAANREASSRPSCGRVLMITPQRRPAGISAFARYLPALLPSSCK